MDQASIEKRIKILRFLDERASMFYPNEYRTSGIYAIINTVNGKIYIGQTSKYIDKYLRKERIEKLRLGKMHRKPLQEDFKKYGPNNFQFFILERIINLISTDEPSSTLENYEKQQLEETLNFLEVYYIDKFHTDNNMYGYNFERGGDNSVTIDDIIKIKKENVRKREEWVYGEMAGKKSIGFVIAKEFIKDIKIPPNGIASLIEIFIKQDHGLTSFKDYTQKFIDQFGDRESVQESMDNIPYFIARQVLRKFPDTKII
ncbi:GIY-YIG nuclease family protein [Paenibacillus elgii]|uniref:GIY-YIG nuclease family protein n=1 Tax=Paenibacillus elgii TaxID=189691 RepID=UPI0020412D15|nr:GIY-YIG nuclease family protein [Paenibacillus elgii]